MMKTTLAKFSLCLCTCMAMHSTNVLAAPIDPVDPTGFTGFEEVAVAFTTKGSKSTNTHENLVSFLQEGVSHEARICELYKGHAGVLKSYRRLMLKFFAYATLHSENWQFEKLLEAATFSAEKHLLQVRKDAEATPYIIHPLGVAELLWDTGRIRSTNVLIAALLHDTLEDTETTEEEIEERFGPRVLYTVKEVTNDPALSSEENKQRQVDHASLMTLDGQLVKLADRLYNVRDTNISPPPSWTEEKCESYRLWGKKLLKAFGGANRALEKALEKEVSLNM